MDANPRYLLAALYLEWGAEKALDFVKKLAENDVQVRRGRTLQAQLLCAGEFALTVDQFADNIVPLARQGCPARVVLPNPMPVHITSITMIEGAPHPLAAALFYDYLLSKAVMEKFAQQGLLATRKDVSSSHSEFIAMQNHPHLRALKPEEMGPIQGWIQNTIEILVRKKTR
jgi:ABC-type Fe3+ transport system substrate-binding protein